MELRTDYQKTDEKDKGSGSLDGLIDKYISNVQSNPTMKLRLLSMASNSGVDPVILAPLLDLSEEDMKALQQAQQTQQQQAQQPQQQQGKAYEQLPDNDDNTDMPEQTETAEPRDMTPDELLEFMDQIIDLTGEDMTLKELREFGENNPDVLETAIHIAF